MQLLAGLAGAVLASAAILWVATSSWLVALAFVLAASVLLGGFVVLDRMRDSPAADSIAAPDWSVTVAAIERSGEAIAITDRANRMVCANSLYLEHFGVGAAPPALPLPRAGLEAVTLLARNAWRDGADALEMVEAEDERQWQVSASRAGRGEDHLIWRLRPIVRPSGESLGALDLTGPFGKMLSRAGIETAITTADGVIRAVSAGFAERASGDDRATLVGQDFVSFLRSDERDRIFFAREGRGGTPQTLVDVPLVDPEARVTPAGPDEATSLMLLIDSGVGIGSGWDGASQAGVAQLDALLAQLPLGLAMTDRDGRFLFANEAFLRSVGREGRGLPPFPTDLVVREDKAALSDAVRRHGRGPSTSGDVAVRLANSPEEPVSLGLAGVRGLGEAAVLLSLADTSQENQLRRQVAQATKMQAVGQLAGGVAHDFNNVLTAIIGTCDLMLLRHIPGDSDYDDIQQIRANSNRAASLTRQLLAFSRQQTLRPEIIQLPDVVSEVSPLIKRLLGEKITYYVQHDRNLGPVRADPQQLEQVIMNLAVNARDAIQSRGNGTGRISLFTRTLHAKQVIQLGSEVLPPADYTVLIVQDTGGGIPPHVLPKLFEPFFTTKEQGKGTGLGLSTAYGIVKQSGGFIFADNITDKTGHPTGARFTVYFPVHRGEVPKKRAPAPIVSSDWSAGGKVLLVEDEDMVRTVAERALSRAGYTVTACANGEEGLAAITDGGAFDIVVSDVVMPGMDGPAMVRAIRAQIPSMPVLFMSGYAEEQLRRDIDIPDMHFIAKPFSVAAIGDKVGAVLRQARSEQGAGT
ncbi:hybrid sensor histidine kinase/response regulator [Porphyrobacter sp. HT-58-2]|uniref:hybrid sensor histidine kinase/response regulator n=1 Tax=Porphyrobacter sp. HT-58-2 TaxID=2023229 RepID=UPI000CDCDA9B|nr:PAS domain-containing sensor histidine kinase [Porphyrobacter sp. HT-58-2]AUX70981.1 hybrid sensor histidine kinase/response regulator [Porphyrobacter sp. HT-58-2]